MSRQGGAGGIARAAVAVGSLLLAGGAAASPLTPPSPTPESQAVCEGHEGGRSWNVQLETTCLADLALRGIVKTPGGFKAVVELERTGKSFTAEKGALLYDGIVTDIDAESVTIRQTIGMPARQWLADGSDETKTRLVRRSLHPESTIKRSSYEEIMQAEPTARDALFSRLSPADKADIMKTHMRRWLNAHRPELSAKQQEVIEANIATLAPEFYQAPTSREWRDRAVEQFERAREVFSPEQMADIFTLRGRYVPEAK